MKLSKTMWQSTKEVPRDAEIVSHQLMVRAGLIHKVSPGLFTYLPFAILSMHKIEKIIREEMRKIDCPEVSFSMVTPAELWKESGRWEKMGPELMRMIDRSDKEICLSPTNEEAALDVFRKQVKSYKQLPLSIYQINTKYRDEIRPRFGLMRGREFSMKDAYSFHLNSQCLDHYYQKVYQAYQQIFSRMGLDFMVVQADGGNIGGSGSKTHEFQVLAKSGEDALLFDRSSCYAANVEKAVGIRKLELPQAKGEQNLRVHTPNIKSIQDVAQQLDCPQWQCLKALLYQDQSNIYCFFLLGDDKLNLVKAHHVTGAKNLHPVKDQELQKLGLIPGFIGPLGLVDKKVHIIFDQAIDRDFGPYVVGANEQDYHLENFIIAQEMDEKDYKTADLRVAKPGDFCPSGGQLQEARGIEVGHIFQLGDLYSKAMSTSVLNQDGKPTFPLMGCYGIGVSRTLAAAIEQSHDESGIIWPKSIAPFHIYFAVIGKTTEFRQLADEIYQELLQEGIEVVYDDRGYGPGFMFKDADLLGLPLRVTLGQRDYEESGLIELKQRKSGEVCKVSRSELIGKIQQILASI